VDWPGALADERRAFYGQGCVPLILNGACGNINPWDPFNPDYKEDHYRMGCILAETAGTSHRNTEIYGWCRFGLEIKTPEDSSQKTGHKEG